MKGTKLHTSQLNQLHSANHQDDEAEQARLWTLQSVLDGVPKDLTQKNYDHGRNRELKILTFSSKYEFVTNYGVFKGQRRLLRQFRPLLKKKLLQEVPGLESISIDIYVIRVDEDEENGITYSSDYLSIDMRGRFRK